MGIFIEDEVIQLIPYTHDDDLNMYKCCQDKHTILGFNYKTTESFEEFQKKIDIDIYRFWATVVHKKTDKKIGSVRLSPFESNPDLSIWIFKRYRRQGYGKRAYHLALKYCFFELGLTEILANCYEEHEPGKHLLESLHFIRIPAHDLNERSVITGELTRQLGYQITHSVFTSRLTE